MRPVGYLMNTRQGPIGEAGLFYNYILAGNGIFVRARSPLLGATVQIADAPVRGLLPFKERVELPMGSIPKYIYNLALSILFTDRCQERYLAVTWEGEYRLKVPYQETSTCGVIYERLPSTVLDIHSHGTMRPFFSGTDDQDEQGLRLYMVVGRLDTLMPEIEMRIGVYGYFAPILLNEVFDV